MIRLSGEKGAIPSLGIVPEVFREAVFLGKLMPTGTGTVNDNGTDMRVLFESFLNFCRDPSEECSPYECAFSVLLCDNASAYLENDHSLFFC